MLLWIVCGKLLDPPKVGFGRTFAEAFELDKAGELLIPIF